MLLVGARGEAQVDGGVVQGAAVPGRGDAVLETLAVLKRPAATRE